MLNELALIEGKVMEEAAEGFINISNILYICHSLSKLNLKKPLVSNHLD